MKARTSFLVAALILVASAIASAAGPQIVVEGASPLENSVVRAAYGAVLSWYADKGYQVGPNPGPRVIVQQQITCEGLEAPEAFGLYNPETGNIHLVGYESQMFREGRFLATAPSVGLYRSLIVHELAHFVNSILALNMSPAFDELVAATVQFETMEPSLRAEIIAGANPVDFGSVREITISAYWQQPVGFLVGAYLFGAGCPCLVSNIIAGRGPKLKDPLYVEWVD